MLGGLDWIFELLDMHLLRGVHTSSDGRRRIISHLFLGKMLFTQVFHGPAWCERRSLGMVHCAKDHVDRIPQHVPRCENVHEKVTPLALKLLVRPHDVIEDQVVP